MKIDNFLFWLMRKWFLVKFKSDQERFQRYIPKMFDAIQRHGLESYNKYQEDFGEKNKEYLGKCLQWRKNELRRIRYLDKLEALCSTWTWSDDESDSDNSNDTSIHTWGSISSFKTVIETESRTRFAEYPETESLDLHTSTYDNGASDDFVEGVEAEVSTQTFTPSATSTQNK